MLHLFRKHLQARNFLVSVVNDGGTEEKSPCIQVACSLLINHDS